MKKKLKRYYIDFYDASDGWIGEFGLDPDRLFESLDEARACRDRLNTELPTENKAMGEHYSIIDRHSMTEVLCSF